MVIGIVFALFVVLMLTEKHDEQARRTYGFIAIFALLVFAYLAIKGLPPVEQHANR